MKITPLHGTKLPICKQNHQILASLRPVRIRSFAVSPLKIPNLALIQFSHVKVPSSPATSKDGPSKGTMGAWFSGRIKNAKLYRSSIPLPGNEATRCKTLRNRPPVQRLIASPRLTTAWFCLGIMYSHSSHPSGLICNPGESAKSIVREPRSVCGVWGTRNSKSPSLDGAYFSRRRISGAGVSGL